MKKNQQKCNSSKVNADQVSNGLYEAIYLGADLDKRTIMVTRTIDHATPQPAQRFSWAAFWTFVRKQTTLAKKVYLVYEAGAFGFWICRRLREMKVECFVVHPEKLDPGHKRVQTDKLDSRHLVDKLQRYVLGNKKAMVPVYVPTPDEEQRRIQSRHRRSLAKELWTLQRRGKGLLLSQGIFENRNWWKESEWSWIKKQLSPELQEALEDDRALIFELEKRVRKVEEKVENSAPKELPRGFGRLTFAILRAELCNFQRFQNRRNVGGFLGLCGGVSASGSYHLDLSINKAGSGYLRTLLVELAWRMILRQPKYTGLRVWNSLGGGASRRRRKIAVVAVARQLAVDVWKWQTGRVTPEQLGWEMSQAA